MYSVQTIGDLLLEGLVNQVQALVAAKTPEAGRALQRLATASIVGLRTLHEHERIDALHRLTAPAPPLGPLLASPRPKSE